MTAAGGHGGSRISRFHRGMALALLCVPALLQAQTYPSPLTNTASVAAPAEIADPVAGNNTASDSNVLALQAQLSLSKTLVTPSPVVAGGAVQYRLQVSNAGPSMASAVVISDNVSSVLTAVSWTCTPATSASSCAQASGTGNAINVQVNVGVGDNVVLLVSATAPQSTPATVPGNTASLVLPPGLTDPTPGDNTASTAAIPVQPAALVANNDAFAAAIDSSTGGTTPSVLDNDTLAGSPLPAGSVLVTLINAPSGYAIAGDGVIDVPANAAAGAQQLTYQICETRSPTNCATATASFIVTPRALDDSFNVSAGSTLTATVAGNDNAPTGAAFSAVGTPPPGLVLQGDGQFTYAPPGGIVAPATFPYQVCLPAPNAALCSQATVSIVVDAAPLDAVNDSFATAVPAGGGSTPSVLDNDLFNASRPQPGQVQLTLLSAPGGYSIASNGVISVPAAAAAGAQTLTYELCEAALPGNCDTASVRVVVAPAALADSFSSAGGGQPINGSVAVNDSIASGSVYTVSTAPTLGTLQLAADGGFSYTPVDGNTGSDSFTYQVCLPAPDDTVCATAVVTLQIGGNVLAAVDDLFSTPVPSTGGATPSVLANDTRNGVALTATQVVLSLLQAPAGYSLGSDGGVQVPAGATAGTQTLRYRVCEQGAPQNCAEANVQLVVAPDAVDDSVQATAGVALTGSLAGNDNPPTGGQYSLLTPPAQGSVVINADGSFSYTAQPGYSGQDSFGYQLCLPSPNAGVCDTATVTIGVGVAVVDAVDDDFRTAPVSTTGGLTASVLDNDTLNGSAVDAARMSVVLTGTPPLGFVVDAQGRISVPAGAQAGPLQLQYQLCEAGTSNCDTANVQLVIAPDAVDDAFSTRVGQTLNDSVASNDNVPAGASFSVLGTVPPGLQLGPNGSFSYTPPAQFVGTLTFAYRACLPAPDAGICDTASASVQVTAGALQANDDDLRSMLVNPATGGTTVSVLANDTYNGAIPPDPNEVDLRLVGAPAGYVVNSSGTISVPAGAAAGVVSFSYELCERALPGNCSTAQVQLLLSPVAVNDSFSTQAGVPLAASVASNDNAPAGSVFTASGTLPPGLQFAADGGFTYNPPGGTQGMSSFTYQVCLPAPDSAVCATASATLNVNAGTLDAVDDDFSASALDPAAGGDTPSVLGNDLLDGSAPAEAAVLLTLLDAPAGYSIAGNGSITVPAGASAGAVTVTYQVCEAALPSNCDTARARVLILPQAAADVFSTPAGQLLAGTVASNDNVPAGAVFTLQGTPLQGLVFAADGSFQYTPPADFTGPVSFGYQVCLPAPDAARCSTATVTLNVNAGTLQALDDNFSATPVAPGASLASSVLDNDALNGASPVAPASVTTALVGAPAGFVLDAAGRVQVPAAATAGRTVLTYQLCERAAPSNCASAAVTLLVTPQAANDAVSVAVGGVLDASVAGNDNLPPGALFSVVGTPPQGLQFGDNGSFRYTPPAGTPGPVQFDYQACLPAPDAALCAAASVTITLNAGTLLAADDDFSATLIDPRTGGLTASVLGNDSLDGVSPPDMARVQLSLAAAPTGFSIDAQGRIVVAAGSPAGAQSLTYQLCEAALPSNCDSAVVRVLVAPVAVADALSTLAGQVLNGNVGSNDVVAAGAQFSLTTAAPGGLQFNADGSFSYAPPVGVASPVSFGYQQCLPVPDAGVCAQATVTININNGALDAQDDDFTSTAVVPGGSTGSVLVNDVLNAVTPPPAAAVQVSLVGAPGGYAIDADGRISVPEGTVSGEVTLTYQLCEAAAPTNCDTAQVSMLVAPQPRDDVLSTPAGQTLVASVAGNDNLPPGASFSVVGAAPPGLTLQADGTVRYEPPVGVTSPVSFSYQACLPTPYAANCATATVTINVNNGALQAVDDDFTASPQRPGASSASVLDNDALNGDTPPPTSVLLSLVAAPAGTSITGDGRIAIAAGQIAGLLELTYQLCEAAAPANCDSAQVRLLVAPTPVDDSFSTRAGVTVSGDVAGNDNVPQGAVFSLTSAAPAGLQFTSDGRYTYAPPVGVSSPVTFDYQVCLPAPYGAVCGTAAVTITVAAGSLSAIDDDFSATPLLPGALSPSVLDNDALEGVSPPASGDVLLTLQGAPPGYAINANGSISIPAAAATGAVVLRYQVCEAAAPLNCASAQVRLLLQPVAVDDAVSTLAGQPVSGNLAGNDTVPAGAVYSIPAGAPPGLVLLADGSFTYTPPVGAPSPLQVSYQVCLPAPDSAVCSTASVTFTVNNGALDAVDDDFSAMPLAPGSTTTTVLGNDSLNGSTPPVAADVSVSLVGAPAGYSIDAAGVIRVPDATGSGAVTLTYQLCEVAAPGNCDNATVLLLVAPQPQADVVSTPAGQTVVGQVGSNDGVPPGSIFSLIGNAPTGLVFNADGSFSFAPPIGVSSPVTFQYRVCLPAPYAAVCASAEVTINVNNGSLSAADDDFSASPVAAGGSTASVLGNDSLNGVTPPPAAAVQVSLVAAPAGFTLANSGEVQIASGVRAGAVLLTYQLCEAAAPSNCDTAQARVVVAPQPQADATSVAAGQTLLGSVAGNDNLPPGAVFTLQSAAVDGLQFNADGSFSYTPPAGITGPVTFSYQACLPAPDAAVCGSASVSIAISTAALLAVDDDFRSTPLRAGGSTPSVLDNDALNGTSPPPAGAVVLTLLAAPSGYAIAADGVISVPAQTPSGAVALTYQLCEAAAPGNCATAQVRLLLTPAPANDVFSTPAGQALDGDLSGNDNVPVGAVYSIPAGAPAGLTLGSDGRFSYSPPVGVASPVVFTYQVCLPAPDAAVCATATATLNVNNGALSASDDDFGATALLPGQASASVLGNDSLNGESPPASTRVILSLLGAPAGFSIGTDGRISVSGPVTSGLQVLTYQLCEAAAPSNCDTAEVRLLLSPQPLGDVVSTPAGQSVTGSVGSNDNVPAGAVFSIPGGAPPGLTFNSDGSFVYAPPSGTTGAVSISYQVCLPAPHAAVCATAVLTINVNNGALVAVDDDFSGKPLTAGATTPSVLANDSLDGASPPAPATVQLSLVGAPAGYAIAADGRITVPVATTAGAVTVTYQVCQSAAPDNCDSASVRLLLAPLPVNDVQSLPAGGMLAGNVGDNDSVPLGSSFTVIGAVPAGLAFNADGSYVYAPPAGTTGTVTVTYQVCLPTPDGAVCATATLSFSITTASVQALDDDFRATPIAAGGSSPSVLANDSLAGISPPPAGTALLSLVASPPGVQLASDGRLLIAIGTSAGALALDYQLCEAAAPSNCDTATVRLIVAPQPQDDAVSTLAGQPVSADVSANDGLPAGSRYSLLEAPPAGLQFTADGRFTYTPPTGAPSPVTFRYQACLPAPDDAVCGSATVTLTTNSGALSANDDDFSSAPIAAGGSSPSVLGNDALNGATPPAATDVVVSLVGAPTGYGIAVDGRISVPTGSSAGAQVLTYQLCEAAAPGNCDSASVRLVVQPRPADDVVATPVGQAVNGSVATNDNVPAGAVFGVVGSAPAGLQFNADGSFSYAPPAGVVSPVRFDYQVCLPAPDAAVCATASVTVNINNGALVAADDDFRGTVLQPGASTTSVLGNDSLNGINPPPASAVQLSLVGAPAGFSITADGRIGTATTVVSGAVNLTYQLCETLAPGNCDSAVVQLLLAPLPSDDVVPVQAGQGVAGSVAGNDNVPPGAQFSVVGAVPAGLLFNADGSFSYTPPNGTTGTVTLAYQVCLPAPDSAVCARATLSLVVGTAVLSAQDDDFSPTPIVPGGSSPSVLGNDALNGITPPAAGTVLLSLPGAPAGYRINADGTVQVPTDAVSGAVSLVYQLCEAAAPSNCATAQVRLLLVPSPTDDVVSTLAGQAVSGNVGSNDRVPPGATFTVVGTLPPGVSFNADGSFSYTPPIGVTGPISFRYQVCLPTPDAAQCGSATVTINVNTGTLLAADDDFTAVPVRAGGQTASVLANDSLNGTTPPAAASVLLSLVGAPSGLTINPDGSLGVASGATAGRISLTYQICEAAAPANCDSATVAVLVAPMPVDDGVSTPVGRPTAGNVASNDGLPAGAVFSVVGSAPAGLVFNGDGSFTYTPPAGFSGQLTVTYQACLPAPDAGVCGTASLVLNVNTGTVSAVADDFSGTSIVAGGSTPSVLGNDELNGVSPPAAGSVVLTLVSAPAGYVISADGVVTVPADTPSGPVLLTYQLCEAAAPGNCATADIRILLTPSPQADTLGVQAGQTLNGRVDGNDNVPPGSQFSVPGALPPGLQFNADGSFSYTPPPGTSGAVSFTYQVCLPAPDSAVCGTASVTFTVASNVVLAVNDDLTGTPVDPAVGGTISRSVLDNDTFNGVSPPPLGSVTATLAGSTPGYTMNNQGQIMVAPGVQPGLVQLAYELCENGVPGNCSTAIASVRVQGPVGVLLAVDDNGGPIPSGPAVDNLLNVFSNDTLNSAALDPSRVSFVPVATAALAFGADGALNVAADLAPGAYSTTYTLCLLDQPTVCSSATVSVQVVTAVIGVEASDDAVEMPQNGQVDIDVLGNDRSDGSPIDPATVVVTISSPPPFGTAQVLPQARLRFVAAANFAGTQSFQYQVCEVANPSACSTATVTVTVAANQLQLVDDVVTVETQGPVVIDVLGNDSTRSAPLDPASLQVVLQPGNGSVVCAQGRCTYTPSSGFFGTDSFRYRVCDVSVPTPACAEANVAVTVAGEQATLRLTKVGSKRTAQIGDLVRYTITVDNVGDVDANGVTLLDTLPPGFSFTRGGFAVTDADNSARTSGVQPLRIEGIDVPAGGQASVIYYLRIGAGTGSGVHTNRITAVDGQGRSIANVASADVDVRSDPLLDESLIVGSVFDDRNGNGIQDAGERGVPGVRVASVEGLLMETDAYGRYHVLGIEGGQARGRNFILKVDPSTLPAGARFTTANPLVRRITPGLPVRFDFGVVMPAAALERSVDAAGPPGPVLEFADALFTAGSSTVEARHAALLEQAARALVQRQGGEVRLLVSAGQETWADARLRALAEALAARLPPGLGDRIRAQWLPAPAPGTGTTGDDGKGR